MTQQNRATLLRGGLDLATPPAAMDPGRAIAALNYESVAEGYGRVGGYERLDGRPKPHLASYWTLHFTDGFEPAAIGATVTSGAASGVVIADTVVEGGAFGQGGAWGGEPVLWGGAPLWWGEPASGYIVLSEVTEGFEEGDALTVSAATVATAAGEAQELGAPTATLNDAYLAAAVARRRSLIQSVPGSGPVRGVCVFGGECYAVRNNAGATAAVLHRATSSGWVAIAPSPVVFFTNGTARFSPGEALTRGAATATIRSVVTTGGDYAAGTATGYLVLANLSGTFAAGSGASASGAATLTGVPAAPTIPAGGRYDFTINNFGGPGSTARMYLAGGVTRAFEYDRATNTLAVVRAIPEDALDKPTHVAHFQNHLFLAYASGTALHSGVGAPLDFRALAGAGEQVFGSPFTGFLESSASSLIFAGASRLSYLTGTSAADFQLVELAESTGARNWTIQTVGKPIFMDANGIRDLTTSDTLGGWRRGLLTDRIQPLFKKMKPVARASVQVREKDQYRVYWKNGDGLSLYVGREGAEAMPFRYPVEINCAASGLDIDDREVVLMGGADGFVYQSDVGTSFDGAGIEALVRLAYNHVGSPYRNKVFHSGQVEIVGESPVEISVVCEFGYGDGDLSVDRESAALVSAGGGLWNLADYDRFIWSAHDKGLASFDIDGFGPNVSVAFLSQTATEQPHVLSALILNYANRGIVR